MSSLWRPSAKLETIKQKARLLAETRAFFSRVDIMEVSTPLLTTTSVTDPALQSFSVNVGEQIRFLQTSPEYAMKRWLAAGSGDIYQLGKAFRQDEQGRYHSPEFTLLEWYRVGVDHHGLIDQVICFIEHLRQESQALVVKKVSYRDLFIREFRLDPIHVARSELEALAQQYIDSTSDLDHDGLLDLLLSHRIIPFFNNNELTVIVDYPLSQASLARQNLDGETAARFEVFWGSVELANGFYELSDAEEQRQRFEEDNQQRIAVGLPEMAIDEHLINALRSGLPGCSGVALGMDRLIMKLLKLSHLDEVLSFPFDRV